MNKLTLKQQRFADEYIISGNATQAYRAAYPTIKRDEVARVNGSRLLTNANVKAYIDERMAELSSKKVADQQEVLEFLTSAMRGEVKEPVAILDGDGTQKIVEVLPSVATRKAAAELLGKRYRLWTDRVESDVTGTVVFMNESDIPD